MNLSLIKSSLKKQASYVNSIEGSNKILLWLNSLKCCVRYGATPSDWYFYEMYKYNHRENKEIITNRKNRELDKLFNPREFAKDFDDKAAFNTKYKDFVKRDWIDMRSASREEAIAFVERHKQIVVKPTDLSSGIGIFLFDNNRSNFNDLLNTVNGGGIY